MDASKERFPLLETFSRSFVRALDEFDRYESNDDEASKQALTRLSCVINLQREVLIRYVLRNHANQLNLSQKPGA